MPALRTLPRPREDFIPEHDPVTIHSLDVRIVDPLVEPQWDTWIDSHVDSSIFHSGAWAKVLVESYDHQACYLRICARGELVALVPMIEVRSLITGRRGVCLPFSDYCPPLLFNSFSDAGVRDKLRHVARERSWSYFELRGDSNVSRDAAAAESYYGHFLPFQQSADKLFARFDDSVQRAIRKAERSGLRATVDSSLAAMDSFYRLHARTRRRHGAPPQPRSFFASIQRNIINAGLGFIVLVRSREDVVAAAMFFKHKSNAVYKFGASDERVQELRANNLAMWKAIMVLAEAGVTTLHFGRTEKENTGLRRFKRSWATTEQMINYFKFNIAANKWVGPAKRSVRFHTKLFRALPVGINRLAGAMIYPHLD